MKQLSKRTSVFLMAALLGLSLLLTACPAPTDGAAGGATPTDTTDTTDTTGTDTTTDTTQ